MNREEAQERDRLNEVIRTMRGREAALVAEFKNYKLIAEEERDKQRAEIERLRAALEKIDERTKRYFSPILLTNSETMLTEIKQIGNIAFSVLIRGPKDG